MTKIIYKDESYRIIGACFEVYNQMGSGFLEAVYQECLAIEFQLRSVPFASTPGLEIRYKEQLLNRTYQPDFVCHEAIIVELKAIQELNNQHRAQVHNYLKATGMRLGLLVNFGNTSMLEHERIVR